MPEPARAQKLRKQIAGLVAEYARIAHAPRAFEPGVTPIPASGKVIGEPELLNLVEASLDGWLTTGRFNDEFERKLATFLGVRHVPTTNSGSSANLLAFSALTSHQLDERALERGYDHKYIYNSHLAFNMKITDIQEACVLAQLNTRQASWKRLWE